MEGSLWGNKTIIHLKEVNNKILAAINNLSLGNIVSENNKLIIDVDNPEKQNPIIVNTIVNAGGKVQYVNRFIPSLEEAYLKIMRRK
ncbi:MAG: hypothetical protein PHY59_03700 [Methanobacterium sp.]|nr:hypothetical protein [Methanobacterium sp.]